MRLSPISEFSKTKLARSVSRLLGRRSSVRERRRKFARLQLVEQLEARQLMALDILSVTPVDGSTNVDTGTDLVITFNEAVLKGQGNIHIVNSATGKLGVAVDVTSANVVVSGAVVTVDLPQDLAFATEFTVFVDPGTFIDLSGTLTQDATLLTENFEFLPLGPAQFETVGDGTDFTLAPPINWTIDNSAMQTTENAGTPEWDGWSFADRGFWVASDNQSRDSFTRGQGTIAVADSDEYDDKGDPAPFDSSLISKPIFLNGVAANSVQVTFDSSFRPEGTQTGTFDVRFDGGSWSNLLTLVAQDRRNNIETFAINNPGSGTMEFRWRKTGSNNWWWAFDNLSITGDVSGVPYAGLSNAAFWNFATEEEQLFVITVDNSAIPEAGGAATATLTRRRTNGLLTAGDMVVTLGSSDTTEATVPPTVTIPNGQSSVTFPITAVDDDLIDGTQTVTISASASDFTTGTTQINVLDDDGLNIAMLTPPDNSVDFPISNDLQIVFDKEVKVGSGRIHIVQSSTNTLGFTVDVNSAAVTVSGSTVRINPPGNLLPLTEYYVLIDNGAILDASTDTFANTTLLLETFDLLPLGPFNTESGGDGTDYTKTPPLGFAITRNPTGGLVEWRGWSFADKNSWLGATGDGGRANFTRGLGNIAVADPNAWDAALNTDPYDTFFESANIDLSKIAAGSARLEFDSSFQGGGNMTGDIFVTYDNGSNWTQLAFAIGAGNRNAGVVLSSASAPGSNTGGFQVLRGLNNPAGGTMRFRFAVQTAGNSGGWWAVDNVRVAGDVVGRPWEGIATPTEWNFRSSELPTLRLAIAPPSISEDGGIATVTLSRSVLNAGDLIVNLASNDTSEATVPATVTIPDGQFSTTFQVTAVNDGVLDGDQVVTLTATAAGLQNIPSTLIVKSVDLPLVTTLAPADDSAAVGVSSDFTATFNQNVKKGNGFVHLLRASDNKLGVSIDVKSAAVSISGAVVTINPPAPLTALTDYYVVIDDGAILADNTFVRLDALLLSEDFEKLPLGPAVFEVPLNGDGLDWTATAPAGFSVDNSAMPPGGVPEWTGWTFANKDFWANAGGQSRNLFTRGTGTVAIGDTDEWDDVQRPTNAFNSLFRTPSIDLTNVTSNSVVLEFDSSFRPENVVRPNNQTGVVEVSYDEGTTWSNLLTLDTTNTSHVVSPIVASNIDERRVVTINNGNSGSMTLRFGVTGTNDYWWAIDNIEIRGDVVGLPFAGISVPTTWNVTTADTDTLGLSIDLAEIAENGGVAVGTVTRNLGTSGPVIVALTSSDPARVTIPETVTILDGQASATFNITAIDNSSAGGSRPIEITAATDGFVGDSASTTIVDDEVASVMITEIMYNPAAPSGSGVTSEPRTEWIEIYNGGSVAADLSDWKFSDEDVFGVLKWGGIPAGTVLPAGGIAVVYNSWFGLTTESMFRAEWSVPAAALVIGVPWSDLANDPSSTNEILNFRDAGGAALDLVNFASGGQWPASTDGRSIFLKSVLTSDNNVGANWALSNVGQAGAINPTGPVHWTGDIGSPGFIDLVAPSAPTVKLDSDTGVAGDLITSDGSYTVTPAEAGGTVEYQLNGGGWTTSKPAAIEGANLIESRQTDAAGNVGDTSAIAFTLDTIAATVTAVYASSTGWSPAFIDTVDGGGAGAGNRLGFAITSAVTLPWANINRLYIQFSERVTDVSATTLELRNSIQTMPFTVSFNPTSFIATLDFASPLVFSKLRLAAADTLVDIAGNGLDGDASGAAGGVFNFRFDVVPGDASGDGSVTALRDLAAYRAAFNTQAGQANFNPRADWSGNGAISALGELAVYRANFNANIGSLPEPAAPFNNGGSGGASISNGGRDSFFGDLGEEDDKKKRKLGDDLLQVQPISPVLGIRPR